MALARNNPSRDIQRQQVPVHDYVDWKEQQSSLEDLAGFYEGIVNVRWADRPERFDGAFITANTFAVVGVTPLIGRGFGPGEDAPGAPMRLILSYHVWQDRFGGDPGALGQVVKVNGESGEIVGLSRAMALLLFQVSASDAVVYALVSLMLVCTGLAASAVPARRATRVDPLVALRSD